MKIANFITMASILGANVFLAIICCTIIICKAMDGPEQPKPEQIVIKLDNPDEFNTNASEDEARKHYDVVVMRLTALGFKYSYEHGQRLLTIDKDKYNATIQPEAQKAIEAYAESIGKIQDTKDD